MHIKKLKLQENWNTVRKDELTEGEEEVGKSRSFPLERKGLLQFPGRGVRNGCGHK